MWKNTGLKHLDGQERQRHGGTPQPSTEGLKNDQTVSPLFTQTSKQHKKPEISADTETQNMLLHALDAVITFEICCSSLSLTNPREPQRHEI